MGRPTVSSLDSSRFWDDPYCKDTAPLTEDSRRERTAKNFSRHHLNPKQRGKKKNFKTSKVKVVLIGGKSSCLTAILAHIHVEGHVFFSCLASLSGFLKDAKSVYLNKRLLACVKRRLTLYIRLLFVLLCILFSNFYFT